MRARAVHRHLLGRCAGRGAARDCGARRSPAPFPRALPTRWPRRWICPSSAPGSKRGSGSAPRCSAPRRRHAAVGALPGDRGGRRGAAPRRNAGDAGAPSGGNAVGASHCACLLPLPPTGGTLDGGGPRQSDLRNGRISFIIPKRSKCRSRGAPSTRPRCSSIGSSSRISGAVARFSRGARDRELRRGPPDHPSGGARRRRDSHPARRADSDPGTARPRRAPGERHRGAAGAGGSPRRGHLPPGQRRGHRPADWLRDLDAFDRGFARRWSGCGDMARRSRWPHRRRCRDLNARQGTGAGDRFLAELGGILLEEIRSPDFVARYGAMSSRCSCRRPAWRGPATLGASRRESSRTLDRAVTDGTASVSPPVW